MTSFTYDPKSPTPQVGGPLLEPGGGPVDNSDLERRDDVITFDTPPLTEAVEYTGTPTVELWITADVPAPQLFVRLNVVDADGTSTNITDTLIAVEGIGVEGGIDSERATLVTVTLPPTSVLIEEGERAPAARGRRSVPPVRTKPRNGGVPGHGDHIPRRQDRDPPRRRPPEPTDPSTHSYPRTLSTSPVYGSSTGLITEPSSEACSASSICDSV